MIAPRPLSFTAAERERIERIDCLVALGESAVTQLLDLMSDVSWTVRRAAVAALAALGDEAVAPLCRYLSERRTNENAIAAAVDALSASIGNSATPEVVALLDHPTNAVASDAAQILGRRRASETVPLLARLLEHPDDNVAVSAIEALGVIGAESAIDPLIAVLHRRQFFRTFPALQVLARTSDPRVVVPLANLLADQTYRFEAARALGRTGSPLAIGPLVSLLTHPGDAVVGLVALALADLIERSGWTGAAEHVRASMRLMIAPFLHRFVSAVHATDPVEGSAIAVVLGTIGDRSTMPTLMHMVEDPRVRDAANAAIQDLARAHDLALIDALGDGDAPTRAALLPIVTTNRSAPDIRKLLSDADPEVRARACDALARIGDTAGVPAMFALLDDPNQRVAHAATAAIQSLGIPETATLAIDALGSATTAVRRHALRIIAYLGCVEAFDGVCAALEDGDSRVAELAVAALASFDDRRVDGMLDELSRSPRESIRAAVLRAAAQRVGERTPELLVRGLSDEAAWVRYFACKGLGLFGHSSATPLLVSRLEDPAPQVRIAAIEALAHLDSPSAWKALTSAARSADPDEQRAALVGIGLTDRPTSLDLLVDAAGSTDLATSLIALTGLARRSDPRALATLAEAAHSPVSSIRNAALSLLGDRSDPEAAEALADLALASELDHPVHITLSRPGPARVAAIMARLTTAEHRDAAVLSAALARMHDAPSTAALFRALGARNPAARQAAVISLISIGAEGAPAAIARLATEDPDPEVRRVCAAAGTG